MANQNIKKNCGAIYYALTSVGMLLSIVADVIYWYIPVSDLANGIEHSGMDAVYVLFAGGVLGVIALGVYIAGSFIDKAIVSNSVVQKIIFGISAATLLITAVINFAFAIYCSSLGFVAPVTSTVWYGLGILSTVATVIYIGANVYLFFTGKKN